ncbi:MAG: 23S rRNA (pseudouridine(1915)-N(3))-methyltransferase RlmH [Saccharofermentanales bacterium]
MMKIIILAVGKIKEEWLKEGVFEFSKRLSKYSELVIEEIPDVSDEYGIDKSTGEEGRRLLSRIRDGDFVVALDVHGQAIDSVALSEKLVQWMDGAGARITFIIGGSNGYSDDVLRRANERISLSRLTFPHQFTRLILLEQLFRSFKISRSEKYHK